MPTYKWHACPCNLYIRKVKVDDIQPSSPHLTCITRLEHGPIWPPGCWFTNKTGWRSVQTSVLTAELFDTAELAQASLLPVMANNIKYDLISLQRKVEKMTRLMGPPAPSTPDIETFQESTP